MITPQEIADHVLDMIGEEAAESIDWPWAEARSDGRRSTCRDERIGQTVILTHILSGLRIVVSVRIENP